MTVENQVIIIGAGAAGLMAAIQAGQRGRKVLVLDHGKSAGRKIMISGGGRCNFTNRTLSSDNYISRNPHFCKSALSRFTQWDFLSLVEKHGIAYSERDHGQLFCDGSARDILNMLLSECQQAGVTFRFNTTIESITHAGERDFYVRDSCGQWYCQALVIATGGVSMPSSGASPLGYEIARQFHIQVLPPQAGLVPFTLQPSDKQKLSGLAGIAVDVLVQNERQRFRDKLLFTHRGLSGPAILQMSLYWQPGETVTIDLLPGIDLLLALKEQHQQYPQRSVKSAVGQYLPKRLVQAMIHPDLSSRPLKTISPHQLEEIAFHLHHWMVKPGGTEGYRTAEVTLGGVDCDAISSQSMEARRVPGLFFVGEVLDVTGWLGGYNLQWAWSSGWCAGQAA